MITYRKLPQEILDVLESSLDIVLNESIAKKYQVEAGAVGDVVYAVLTGAVKVSDLDKHISKVFQLPSKKASELASSIAGGRLLVFDSYLQGEVQKYLVVQKVDLAQFRDDLDKQRAVIEVAERQREEEAAPVSQPTRAVTDLVESMSNDAEEHQTAPDIFATSLVPMLRQTMPELSELLEDYNLILLSLLDRDPKFKGLLENAIYRNNEELTSKPLVINNKQLSPTIGNWLKAFIAKVGPNYFDNVVLSEYLTNDMNCRQLTADERSLLSRVLTMYRTIKFFPASLSNIPPEQWQVIPIIDHPEGAMTPEPAPFAEDDEPEPKGVSPQTPSQSDTESSNLAAELRQYDWKSMTPIERRALLEQYSITEADLTRLGIT